LDILMIAGMVGLLSAALLLGGLDRMSPWGRRVRVAPVLSGLLGLGWAALVPFQVPRQAGRWGPISSDPSTTCTLSDGQRLGRLEFVGLDRACGPGFEPFEHDPGLLDAWPFCDDQGASVEFADVCTVSGRAGIRSGDFIRLREQDGRYFSTARAITIRCTSLVPSPISQSFASRKARSTGKSRV
jgi:hypothetical protein